MKNYLLPQRFGQIQTVILLVLVVLCCLLPITNALGVPDPRDSVILESKTVSPGSGDPAAFVRVFITNKDTLSNLTLVLVERSVSGGAYMTLAQPRNYDSVTTLLTTTLKSNKFLSSIRYNSVSPDTFTLAGLFDPMDLSTAEPPNLVRKEFLQIKFDTIWTNAGTIELDSAFIHVGNVKSSTGFVDLQPRDVRVNFVKGIITVPDVTPPSVTVTAPNGGEAISKSPCPPFTITWNATDNVGVTGIEILLDRTNGGESFELQIANLSGNPGSYDWAPTGQTSNNAKIKIIARDAAGNSSPDVSDGVFSIISYCSGKMAVNFDINQDGVLNLVDAIMAINSIQKDENSISSSKEYIESMLNTIFSDAP